MPEAAIAAVLAMKSSAGLSGERTRVDHCRSMPPIGPP
jgi:hypothetical protein